MHVLVMHIILQVCLPLVVHMLVILYIQYWKFVQLRLRNSGETEPFAHASGFVIEYQSSTHTSELRIDRIASWEHFISGSIVNLSHICFTNPSICT